MTYKDKFPVIIIAAVLAAVFVLVPFYNPKKEMLKRSMLPELLSKENVITFDEMNRFLETWSKFITKKYHLDGKEKIDWYDKKPQKVFPHNTLKWVENQGWDVNRFFEVENRLRAITIYASRKKGSDLIIRSLENQLAQTTDPEMTRNIMAMIDEQSEMYKNVKDTKFSDSEVRMVMPNLEIVKDILDGKAIYRPAY